MLQVSEPHIVVAFPGGKGTKGCVEAARKYGHFVIDLRDGNFDRLTECIDEYRNRQTG